MRTVFAIVPAATWCPDRCPRSRLPIGPDRARPIVSSTPSPSMSASLGSGYPSRLPCSGPIGNQREGPCSLLGVTPRRLQWCPTPPSLSQERRLTTRSSYPSPSRSPEPTSPKPLKFSAARPAHARSTCPGGYPNRADRPDIPTARVHGCRPTQGRGGRTRDARRHSDPSRRPRRWRPRPRADPFT